MVPAKKAPRKVSRDAKEIVITAEPTMPKTVVFSEDPAVLRELLDEAPEVPCITTVEQAVAFVDKYAKWKAKTKR